MRVVVTGGAGFIGRHVVARVAARGDDVVALVRDPDRARHIEANRVTLVRNDLAGRASIATHLRGADVVIHGAGSYRVGIAARERPMMLDANVGSTERVLDAALDVGVQRIVYVSTNGIYGDTKGRIVDESYRRDPADGFLSYYDETKYLAHEAAEKRIAAGAPLVIVQPGQVYGPNDHSDASAQLALAHAGKLRVKAFLNLGLAWVHVADLADAIVSAIDRGRTGEAYSLAGECLRIGESLAIAARVGGHRAPRLTVPTMLLKLIAPLSDPVGGLPGLPRNLHESIRAADNVTYWASHDKASRELGFAPRSLEQGVADTWGRA